MSIFQLSLPMMNFSSGLQGRVSGQFNTGQTPYRSAPSYDPMAQFRQYLGSQTQNNPSLYGGMTQFNNSFNVGSLRPSGTTQPTRTQFAVSGGIQNNVLIDDARNVSNYLRSLNQQPSTFSVNPYIDPNYAVSNFLKGVPTNQQPVQQAKPTQQVPPVQNRPPAQTTAPFPPTQPVQNRPPVQNTAPVRPTMPPPPITQPGAQVPSKPQAAPPKPQAPLPRPTETESTGNTGRRGKKGKDFDPPGRALGHKKGVGNPHKAEHKAEKKANKK